MAEKEPEVAEPEALPRTIVRRLVKEKLSQLSSDTEISLLRDSLSAFSESSRVFIHYLSSTAHDICKESNRQIINAEDVFKALEEIEFAEFVGPLKSALEEFRQKNSDKKAATSSAKAKDGNKNKQAKRKESPAKNETPRSQKRHDAEASGE